MPELKSILLAEDDAVLRKLYCHILKLAGYNVSAAADGFEAMDFAKNGQYELMVIDVMMPNMDGLDLCRQLRGKVGGDIPIVFLTALDDADTLKRCADAGADDYLVKEGSPEGLLQRVDYWRRYHAGLLETYEIRPRLQDRP